MTGFGLQLIWLYNAILICIPLLVLLGVLQLIVAVVAWRSPKRHGRLKRGAGLILAAACIPILLLGLWRGVIRPYMASEMEAQRAAAVAKTSFVTVGDQIPLSELPLTERSTDPSTFKFVVLNFFATWCGPCLAEMPKLQALADKYQANQDVFFLVVGREESQETIDAFLRDNPYRMQFVADPDRKLYSRFAKELIPRTYLLDEGGKIAFEIVGFDEEKLRVLETELDQLVGNNPQ